MATARSYLLDTTSLVSDLGSIREASTKVGEGLDLSKKALGLPGNIATVLGRIESLIELDGPVYNLVKALPFGISKAIDRVDDVLSDVREDISVQRKRIESIDERTTKPSNAVDHVKVVNVDFGDTTDDMIFVAQQISDEALRIEQSLAGQDLLPTSRLQTRLDNAALAFDVWQAARDVALVPFNTAVAAIDSASSALSGAIPTSTVLSEVENVVTTVFTPVQTVLSTIRDALDFDIPDPRYFFFQQINLLDAVQLVADALSAFFGLIEDFVLDALKEAGVDIAALFDGLKNLLLTPLRPVFDEILELVSTADTLFNNVSAAANDIEAKAAQLEAAARDAIDVGVVFPKPSFGDEAAGLVDFADQLVGGDGEDALFGLQGNDTLSGANGDDFLFGGIGNDSQFGGAGSDEIYGGPGDDTLNAGDFAPDGRADDTLDGGAGYDIAVIDLRKADLNVVDGNGPLTLFNSRIGTDVFIGIEAFNLIGPDGGRQLYTPAELLEPEIFEGTSDDDTIRSTNGQDSILGFEGDDFLDIIGGNDTVFAGPGNDVVLDFWGDDYIDAGEGNDRVTAAGGDDTVYGGPGNDTVFAGFGQDRIFGGDGDDLLQGPGNSPRARREDDGTITILETSRDYLDGGPGNDYLSGGAENDTLLGGSGDDTLDAGGQDDELDGGSGTDLVAIRPLATTPTFTREGDVITGQYAPVGDVYTDTYRNVELFEIRWTDERGTQTFFVDELFGRTTLTGTEGRDTLLGWDGDNDILGLGGDDRLIANGGDDSITGGEGRDHVDAGWGDDTIDASDGTVASEGSGDYILPGLGADQIIGNAALFAAGGGINLSYDNVSGTGGLRIEWRTGGSLSVQSATADLIDDAATFVQHVRGSMAADRFEAIDAQAGDRTVFAGLDGNDTIIGGAGMDYIDYSFDVDYEGYAGITAVFTKVGEGSSSDGLNGVDSFTGVEGIIGSIADDNITGSSGAEHFVLGYGDDSVVAGGGNDTIDPGAGNDTLTGGAGADTFVVSMGMGMNILTDFDTSEDSLDRSGLTGAQRGGVMIGATADGDRTLTLPDGSGLVFLGLPEDAAPTGSVEISGIARQGETLTADASTVDDADGLGDITLQWLRDDAVIAGAQGDTYSLTQADVGAKISARASFTDGFGAAETVKSKSSAAVANVNDLPTGSVDILGAAVRGGTLEARDIRLFDDDGLGPVTLSWQQDGLTVGAGDQPYMLGGDDVGTVISLLAEFTDQFGADESLRFSNDTLVTDRPLYLVGTDQPDALNGGAASDTIEGHEGDDTLTGFDSDDFIYAGTGNDLLVGGPGADVLQGDDGQDTLRGGAGNDTLDGGAGNDLIEGEGGDDRLLGGAGADTILAGTGNDLLEGGAGKDRLDGGTGADTMQGGQNGDVYLVNDPGDVVTELATDIGIDKVASSVSFDLGGQHIETLVLGGSNNTDGTGNALDNYLLGNRGNNTLHGEGGDDRIEAGAGEDELFGGAGNDTLNGGPGSDIIHVDDSGDRVAESNRWAGTDVVISSVDFRMGSAHVENLSLVGTARIGAGNGLMNRITGNDADNVLDGGKNNDTLVGGLGDDTYLLRAPGDTIVERADEGIDVAKSYGSFALMAHVEKLFMQTVFSKAGTPVNFNGIGNGLDNTIIGTPFDNTIVGREGSDTLKGQAGADTFVFDRAIGADVDRIIDFNMNAADEGDILKLKGAEFGGLAAGMLADAAFHAGDMAADATDRLIFDQASGRLWFDADGTGAAAQLLVATFDQGAVVRSTDIEMF